MASRDRVFCHTRISHLVKNRYTVVTLMKNIAGWKMPTIFWVDVFPIQDGDGNQPSLCLLLPEGVCWDRPSKSTGFLGLQLFFWEMVGYPYPLKICWNPKGKDRLPSTFSFSEAMWVLGSVWMIEYMNAILYSVSSIAICASLHQTHPRQLFDLWFHIPNNPCMIYFPTFTIKINQM